MKPIISFVAISLFVYSSCSDNGFNNVSPPTIQEQYKGVVYPLKPVSRSLSSFETDWENEISVELNSGDTVNLPWANLTQSSLPIDFGHDIKKEDGWKLILHTFADNNEIQDSGVNYMLFHNYRTGFLKVFYYLLPGHNWPTNMGFWSFKIHVDNEYLNHQNELAIPMDYNFIGDWISTTACVDESISFQTGWNGFQIQLAYDDAINISNSILVIKPKTATVSKNLMFGEFNSESSGTLITHGSKNDIQDLPSDVAVVFGKSAEEIVENYFNDSSNSRTVLTTLAAGVGNAIIKWGANKLFNKLTAGFSKPTTTITDLSFSTKTNGNLTGINVTPYPAPSGYFQANISYSNLGTHLGVWNLASAPTIYIDPLADRTSDYFNGREYNYRFRGITGYNYDLRINPDLEPYLIKHWVDIDVVRYINKEDSLLLNPVANFDYGTLGHPNYGILFSGNRPLTYIYQGDANGKNKIVEEDMRAIVYAREGLYDKYGYSPTTISVPNEAMYLAGDLKYPMKDTYLKFNLFLVTEFEGKRDTTLHTRTFVPKVEWDPVLYNQYGNYSQHEILPKLEIMEENDSTLLTK